MSATLNKPSMSAPIRKSLILCPDMYHQHQAQEYFGDIACTSMLKKVESKAILAF